MYVGGGRRTFLPGDHVVYGGVGDRIASATESTLRQSGCSKSVPTKSWQLFHRPTFSLQIGTKIKSRRADSNRLPLLQLRVIGQALQRFARVCKSRISKRFPLLCLALCCTVLRSQ